MRRPRRCRAPLAQPPPESSGAPPSPARLPRTGPRAPAKAGRRRGLLCVAVVELKTMPVVYGGVVVCSEEALVLRLEVATAGIEGLGRWSWFNEHY